VLIAAIDDIGGVGLVAASPCSVGTSPYAAKRVPLRPNEWLVFIQALGTPLRVNIEPVLLCARYVRPTAEHPGLRTNLVGCLCRRVLSGTTWAFSIGAWKRERDGAWAHRSRPALRLMPALRNDLRARRPKLLIWTFENESAPRCSRRRGFEIDLRRYLLLRTNYCSPLEERVDRRPAGPRSLPLKTHKRDAPPIASAPQLLARPP
jgi:hypothetical protein